MEFTTTTIVVPKNAELAGTMAVPPLTLIATAFLTMRTIVRTNLARLVNIMAVLGGELTFAQGNRPTLLRALGGEVTFFRDTIWM
jgi:hypothetical protein